MGDTQTLQERWKDGRLKNDSKAISILNHIASGQNYIDLKPLHPKR